MTVPRDYFAAAKRAELLSFYDEVFGWVENEGMSIEGERIFLRAPTDRQYVTLRASDAPMHTSGYEHLGVWVESLEQLQQLHGRARERAERDDRVVLSIEDVERNERGFQQHMVIRGRASIEPVPDRTFIDELAFKYTGLRQHPLVLRDSPTSVVVRVAIDRISGEGPWLEQ